MIRELLAAAAIAATAIGAAPAASADPPDVICTQFNEDGSCYYANCTEAKANHDCDIPQGDSKYCSKQDRDGDGIACEC